MYDLHVVQLLDNITFDNFKYMQYPTGKVDDYWNLNTPHALRWV